MGAAHDWIFAGGDLRHSRSLVVFPNGLVVFELRCVLENFWPLPGTCRGRSGISGEHPLRSFPSKGNRGGANGN